MRKTSALCSLAILGFTGFAFGLSQDKAKSILAAEKMSEAEITASEQIGKLLEERVKSEIGANQGVARRGNHAKHHGCVKATFQVADKLPDNLRTGAFKEGKSYDAWIRYSNGATKTKADADPDGRGMAIKLVGVEGTKILEKEATAKTQDFLLLNFPVFFVKNTVDYIEFQKILTTEGKPDKFFVPNPKEKSTWRIREATNAKTLVSQKTDNLLHIRYFSQTPYRLGSEIVKYSAKPCTTYEEAKTLPTTPDFLREALVKDLAKGEACFEFAVQVQADPNTMPTDDPTVLWDEKVTPFQKIATIKIQKQSFDSKPQMDYCENLAFTPWHSLPEHQPLGSINRSRKVVYEMGQKFRHGENKVKTEEPVNLNVPGL